MCSSKRSAAQQSAAECGRVRQSAAECGRVRQRAAECCADATRKRRHGPNKGERALHRKTTLQPLETDDCEYFYEPNGLRSSGELTTERGVPDVETEKELKNLEKVRNYRFRLFFFTNRMVREVMCALTTGRGSSNYQTEKWL